jgi:hypothetical protein
MCQKSSSHFKIRSVRRGRRKKFSTEDPKILGATVTKKEISPGICAPAPEQSADHRFSTINIHKESHHNGKRRVL